MARDFSSLLRNFQTVSGVHPAFYSVGVGVLSLWVGRPGPEIGNSLPSSTTSVRKEWSYTEFYVLLTVHPYPYVIFFQMKSTRCTLLLSIFISTSVHGSGNYVPIVRRTYCIFAALVFFTLYGWLSGPQQLVQ